MDAQTYQITAEAYITVFRHRIYDRDLEVILTVDSVICHSTAVKILTALYPNREFREVTVEVQ
jgi:hypothetical protein